MDLEGGPERPKHQKQPEDEGNCQQKLPEPPEVQVLGTLVTEPEPELSQLVVDAEGLAYQAADDHHHQRPEEGVNAGPLVSGLFAADPRRQEKAAAHPSRCDPEDGELEVPGARQVVGQPAGDVEPVKGSCLHPIMGEHPPRNDCAKNRRATMAKNHPVAHWLGVSFKAGGGECVTWEPAPSPFQPK